MKIRRLICLLLSVILLLLLPACGLLDQSADFTQPTEPQTETKQIICTKSMLAGLYPVLTPPEPTQQNVTFTVDGNSYDLGYVNSSQEQFGAFCVHLYATADKKIRCWYNTANMQLIQVNMDMDLAAFDGMDQQQYEQWIQNFVSQFVQEDWSEYQLVCETWYGGVDRVPSIEGPKEDKPVREYTFEYRKYLHSIKTTDGVDAKFTVNTKEKLMEVSVNFNRHQFNGVNPPEFDMAIVDEAVETYLDGQFTGKDEFVKCSAYAVDEWVRVGEKILLLRKLDVEYKHNGLKEETRATLYIDVFSML